jgi:hypothetical protein
MGGYCSGAYPVLPVRPNVGLLYGDGGNGGNGGSRGEYRRREDGLS